MAFDDTVLQQKHHLVRLNVSSGHQISSRTSLLISKLTAPADEDGRSAIVALTAPAKAASKLISIVEIAKRELTAQHVDFHQYNLLTSRMVEIARASKRGESDAAPHTTTGADEAEASDDAFEAMGQPASASKKRQIPVMTIYLTTAPVRELARATG